MTQATGGYVEFTSEPGEARVRAAYRPDTRALLVAVKGRYDPATCSGATNTHLFAHR